MVYVTDPIGDLLTRIRNAQRARSKECRVPWSHIKEKLCEVLKKEGWLQDISVAKEGHERELILLFSNSHPSLRLKRMSKPGRRLYRGARELKPVLRGYGSSVLTTSEGFMTDKEARNKGIGGEVLCTVS